MRRSTVLAEKEADPLAAQGYEPAKLTARVGACWRATPPRSAKVIRWREQQTGSASAR
jgi:hypothetical protein